MPVAYENKTHFFSDEFNLPHQTKLKRSLTGIWGIHAISVPHTIINAALQKALNVRVREREEERDRHSKNGVCICNLYFVFRWFTPFIVASISKAAHKVFNAIHVNSLYCVMILWILLVMHALRFYTYFLLIPILLFASLLRVVLQWYLSLCELHSHFMHPFDTMRYWIEKKNMKFLLREPPNEWTNHGKLELMRMTA